MVKSWVSSISLWASYILDYPLTSPQTCSIGITNRCNSKCAYCSQWHSIPKNDHPKQHILDLFLQLKALGIKDIMISGGEPFLREDLYDLVNASISCGFSTRIITNGTRLSEGGIIRLAEAGVVRIGISVDTLDPKRYLQIRGIKIEPVLHALDLLKKIKSHFYPNLNIVLYSTITSINIPDLLNLVDFAHTSGFANYFQPVQLDSGAKEKIQKELWPSQSETKLLKHTAQELINRKASGYRIINTENYLRSIPIYFQQGTYLPDRCLAGYTRITIDKNLGVRPCWMFEPVAFINGCNLREIWYSKIMREKRMLIREKQCPGCFFNCHLDRAYTRFSK